MTEYIEKESLRGWTLIPPPTPSGKIITRSVDELPSVKLDIPDKGCDWNWCYNCKPVENQNVEILCFDDHGDSPYTYVTVGWRLDRSWIVDNDLCCAEVVAWRHMPEPLSVKEVKRKLFG